MGLLKEFKDFAVKGNVVDLAVAVVIGGAFGKIVSSFVADIIMPPIGILLGGVNFTDLAFTLKEAIPAQVDNAGIVLVEAVPAVTLNYGNFIQVIFDFLIIAFTVFIAIKALNAAKKKKEEAPEPSPAPPAPTEDQKLLAEIRDLLKNK
jgi:large conductance mechanosensitive channel